MFAHGVCYEVQMKRAIKSILTSLLLHIMYTSIPAKSQSYSKSATAWWSRMPSNPAPQESA